MTKIIIKPINDGSYAYVDVNLEFLMIRDNENDLRDEIRILLEKFSIPR